MKPPQVFESAQAAFDRCREFNRPMVVDVPCEDGTREVLKIFPSGVSAALTDRIAKETPTGPSPRPWRVHTEFSCHVRVVDANGDDVFQTDCDHSNNGMADVDLILSLVNRS